MQSSPSSTPARADDQHEKSNPHQTLGAPGSRAEPARGLLELELMHQWSTTTYKSFCGEMEAEYHTWQVILPREGLQHPFLLDGLLAMASLEIAALQERPNHVEYTSIALEYHDSALSCFRQELESITADKLQAALAFSVLTMALSLAIPHLTKSRDEPQSMVKNIVEHFELLHGVGLIVLQHGDALRDAPILRNLPSFNDVQGEPLETSVKSAIATLNALNEARHNNPFCHQSPASKLQSITYHATYRKAIFHLEELFGKCTKPVHRGFALAWLNLTGRGFIAAVTKADSLALLLLMHWGVLMDRCSEGSWWLLPVGKSLVDEMTAALSAETDPQLRASISWARAQVKAGS